MEKPAKREQLASRLGFLLISAGCAIGLGNVWRFPFITGEYGGACFLLLFIVCQLMVMPVMICEFAIGRASRLNLGMALGRLEPRGTKWHKFSWLNIVGIYTLLMFYTTICG
ncbi:MAG: sodium-dependent transporter, partial [Desulfovibrio sp.]